MLEHILTLGVQPHPYGDKLSVEYPFSIALINVDVKESDEVPTACVTIKNNRVLMYVNPKFIDEICRGWNDTDKIAFIRGVGKHELLHFMFKHLMRRLEYDPKLANIVQDALINTIIPEFQTLLAKGKLSHVTPEEMFERNGDILMASQDALRNDWTWEEYYKAIANKLETITVTVLGRSNSGSGQDQGQYGKLSGDVIPADIPDDIAQAIEEAFEKYAEQLKNAGKMPGWLEREFEIQHRRNSMFKLRQRLRSLFAHGMQRIKQITHTRPNRRFEHEFGTRNWYLAMPITVLVDVSGSVKDEDLQACVDEIYALSRTYGTKMTIFTYDAKVQSEITYSQFKKHGIKTTGGGGTSLIDSLKELEHAHLDKSVVVVFTDGYDTCPQRDAFNGCKQIVYIMYPEHSKEFVESAKSYAQVLFLPK